MINAFSGIRTSKIRSKTACCHTKIYTKTSTHGIHLEVDDLSASEGDDDLPVVDSTTYDCLLARRLPLVHSPVSPNVTNTVRVNLTTQQPYDLVAASVLKHKILARERIKWPVTTVMKTC